jgi:hypothetical protein
MMARRVKPSKIEVLVGMLADGTTPEQLEFEFGEEVLEVARELDAYDEAIVRRILEDPDWSSYIG